MRGGILLSGAFWCFVILSTAAGAEPTLHGIPYKPDPPPAIDGRLDEWENVPNAYTIQTREQVAYGGKAWKSAAGPQCQGLAGMARRVSVLGGRRDRRSSRAERARPGHVARRSRGTLPGCRARSGAAAERLGRGADYTGVQSGKPATHGRSLNRYSARGRRVHSRRRLGRGRAGGGAENGEGLRAGGGRALGAHRAAWPRRRS